MSPYSGIAIVISGCFNNTNLFVNSKSLNLIPLLSISKEVLGRYCLHASITRKNPSSCRVGSPPVIPKKSVDLSINLII